jgi:hypothetical protein
MTVSRNRLVHILPGMLGIRGGSESALAVLASSAPKRALENMMEQVPQDFCWERTTVELLRGFEQVVSWFIHHGPHSPTYTLLMST